jgi:hypothetical protein
VPDTIEADVLEIDGSPPPSPREPEPAWKETRARVLRLDRRWWPLWVVLGLVVGAFIAVFGLVVAVFLIVAKVLGGILRFFAGGSAPRGGTGLSRTPH